MNFKKKFMIFCNRKNQFCELMFWHFSLKIGQKGVSCLKLLKTIKISKNIPSFIVSKIDHPVALCYGWNGPIGSTEILLKQSIQSPGKTLVNPLEKNEGTFGLYFDGTKYFEFPMPSFKWIVLLIFCSKRCYS